MAVPSEAEPRHFPETRDPAQDYSPGDPSREGPAAASHPWPLTRCGAQHCLPATWPTTGRGRGGQVDSPQAGVCCDRACRPPAQGSGRGG